PALNESLLLEWFFAPEALRRAASSLPLFRDDPFVLAQRHRLRYSHRVAPPEVRRSSVLVQCRRNTELIQRGSLDPGIFASSAASDERLDTELKSDPRTI